MNKTSLRVQDHLEVSPRRSTEWQFEQMIADILTERGYFHYHVTEKIYSGVPDRYICGGRWIEFKRCFVQRTITPLRLIRYTQKKHMDNFSKHGDIPYVCMLFQIQDGTAYAILDEWVKFKKWGQVQIHVDRLKDVGYERENWDEMVGEHFTRI